MKIKVILIGAGNRGIAYTDIMSSLSINRILKACTFGNNTTRGFFKN